MRGSEGHVTQKGLVLVPLNKCQRPVGANIHNVTFRADHPAIVVQWRIKILAPMAGGVAKVFFKTARQGVIRPLTAIVPLAECACGVARPLEGVGNGLFTKVQSLLTGGDAIDSAARMIPTR